MFIVKGELSSARIGETDTIPLCIVINLLSLSYNATYTLAREISCVELFAMVPFIVSEKSASISMVSYTQILAIYYISWFI
jgi:hypothetical protein